MQTNNEAIEQLPNDVTEEIKEEKSSYKYRGFEDVLYDTQQEAYESFVSDESYYYKAGNTYVKDDETYINYLKDQVSEVQYYKYNDEKFEMKDKNIFLNQFNIETAYQFKGNQYTYGNLFSATAKFVDVYWEGKTYAVYAHGPVQRKVIIGCEDVGFDCLPIWSYVYYTPQLISYNDDIAIAGNKAKEFINNPQPGYAYFLIDISKRMQVDTHMVSENLCSIEDISYKIEYGSCTQWERIGFSTIHIMRDNNYYDRSTTSNEMYNNYFNYIVNQNEDGVIDTNTNIHYSGIRSGEFEQYITEICMRTEYKSNIYNLNSSNKDELLRQIENEFINNKSASYSIYKIIDKGGRVYEAEKKDRAWEAYKNTKVIDEVLV